MTLSLNHLNRSNFWASLSTLGSPGPLILITFFKKTTPYINLVRSLCGTWWGGHPQSLLQIYKAFILRFFDYGSIILLPRDKPLRAKLEVAQRKALRACRGLRRSTPNRIVYAESCELPLFLRPKKLAFRFTLRAFSVNNNPTLESIESLLSLLNNRDTLNLFELPVLRAYARLNRYRNLIQSSDVLPCFINSLQSQSFLPDVNTNAGRTIQRASHPPSKFLKIFKKILSSSTTFYIDGSKTGAGFYVGLAVYSPTLNLNLQTISKPEFPLMPPSPQQKPLLFNSVLNS